MTSSVKNKKYTDCELIFNRLKALHANYAYMQQLYFNHVAAKHFRNVVRKRERKKGKKRINMCEFF